MPPYLIRGTLLSGFALTALMYMVRMNAERALKWFDEEI